MDDSDPIAIPMDGNAKQAIQTSIKHKLSEITGSQVDDVLPEYVMVMVANHKSKGQVASDLEAFLGTDQAQTFTTWLWDALHSMNSDSHSRKSEVKRQTKEEEEEGDRSRGRDRERERGRTNDTKRESSPSRSVFASVISVPSASERHRTTLDNPAPARLILSAVQDAVKSTANPAPIRALEMAEREQERDRDRDRERDRGRATGRDYGRDRDRDYNSRDRGYNNNNNNNRERGDRDRDRGDRDRSDRSDRGDRGDRGDRDRVFDRLGSRDSEIEDRRSLRGSRDNEYTISPSLSSRLGTPATATSPTKDTNVFLPDTLAGSTRKIEGGEEDPVTFTVTLNGVKDEAETDPVAKSLRNKRRMDDDEMEEDTEMEGTGKKVKKEKCQYWPNCKRGDECAYFHPTIKCKLFPDCPFADKCLYIHPSVPCKFGAKCARPDCAYTHPAPSALSLSGSYSTFSKGALSVNNALPTPNTKFAPVPVAGLKPCKHGFACPREGCTFFHPPNACVYGDACARPGCAFAHGKTCRSGITCTTPGCTFVHAPTIKTPCKFGAGCLNNACRFQHDAPKTTNDESMADAEDTSSMSASLPKTPPRVAAV